MSKQNNQNKTDNILKRIMETIRTESKELTDAVLGSHGTGKIEQECDSAEYKLKEAKLALTQMMRKERECSHLYTITIEKINKQETLISQALANGDKEKALQYAQDVVDLEHNNKMQSESIDSITLKINYLQKQLEQSERELKEYSRQLNMLKTTDKIQKVTETIMNNIDGAETNLLSAKNSLDRLRKKQMNQDEIYKTHDQLVKKYSQINSEKSSRLTEIKDPEIKTSENQAQDVINRIQDKTLK